MAAKTLLAALTAVLLAVASAGSHKPLDALSKRQQFRPSDFFVDIAATSPARGIGLEARPALLNQVPLLDGLGVAYVLVDLAPCGSEYLCCRLFRLCCFCRLCHLRLCHLRPCHLRPCHLRPCHLRLCCFLLSLSLAFFFLSPAAASPLLCTHLTHPRLTLLSPRLPVNQPHTHPRATEFLYMVKGDKMRVQLAEGTSRRVSSRLSLSRLGPGSTWSCLDSLTLTLIHSLTPPLTSPLRLVSSHPIVSTENGGRTVGATLTPGKAAVFPQGLLHYQQNLGCKPAQFLAALSSEDPGTLSYPERLFSLKDDILSVSFGIRSSDVRAIRERISAAAVQKSCLKRCGLA